MTSEEYVKAPKQVRIILNKVTSNAEVKSLLEMACSQINVESTSQGSSFGIMDRGIQKTLGCIFITPIQ
jgi:hypothetical protein